MECFQLNYNLFVIFLNVLSTELIVKVFIFIDRWTYGGVVFYSYWNFFKLGFLSLLSFKSQYFEILAISYFIHNKHEGAWFYRLKASFINTNPLISILALLSHLSRQFVEHIVTNELSIVLGKVIISIFRLQTDSHLHMPWESFNFKINFLDGALDLVIIALLLTLSSESINNLTFFYHSLVLHFQASR